MERHTAQSVIKAMKILELFKQKDEWGIAEIGRELSYPVSSVHRLIASLEQGGLVYKNQDTNRYALDIEVFLLGNHVKIVNLLEQKAYSYIEKLAEELNECVHISIYLDGEAVAVLNATSKWQIAASPHVGQSRRIYATAVGRCLLAFNSYRCYDRFLLSNEELVPYTANTVTDRSRLEEILVQVRQEGVAMDYEEVEENLICTAAPIFAGGKTCIAAMSCSVPKNRFVGREGLIRQRVVDTAREISQHV